MLLIKLLIMLRRMYYAALDDSTVEFSNLIIQMTLSNFL